MSCVRTEMAVVVMESVLGVCQCNTGHTGTHCETSEYYIIEAGDAAHAVVPHMAKERMNAGLIEDCLVFGELLTKESDMHSDIQTHVDGRMPTPLLIFLKQIN